MSDAQYKKKKRGKGITHLSSLFEKYKKTLQAPQGSVLQAFVESVKDVLGIDIPKDKCAYKVSSKIIFIHLPGPIKNEIILSREKILLNLQEKLGPKNTPKNII